jgi:hypothetical protein
MCVLPSMLAPQHWTSCAVRRSKARRRMLNENRWWLVVS